MLWLIDNNASYNVNGCNICNAKNGKWQLWIERPIGTSIMVKEHEQLEEVRIIKDAIDFAIENNHRALRMVKP